MARTTTLVIHVHPIWTAVLAMVVAPTALWASQLTIPHSFTNGTPTDATQITANFAAIDAAVDDNDTRIGALESGGFVFLPSTVNLVTGTGNGDIPWTTVDISAHTGTDTARFAVLRVGIFGQTTSTSYVSNVVNMRATGNAAAQVIARWSYGHSGGFAAGGGYYGQYIVPLDEMERFDYEKVDDMNASSPISIRLEGYLL